MNKYAVIVAGGSGTRMNAAVPKQFMLLKGKPLLYYTLKAFLEAYHDMHIILVLPKDRIHEGREVAENFFPEASLQTVTGGETRFHSVKNGLEQITDNGVVFVHDAVRCLITPALIRKCYDSAIAFGSAVPAIQSKDSLRLVSESGNSALDRSAVRLIQTPQVFHVEALSAAFNAGYQSSFTDEASVAEAFGMKIHLIEGDETNIKITYPADFLLAEYILTNR